jgi:hemoglobin
MKPTTRILLVVTAAIATSVSPVFAAEPPKAPGDGAQAGTLVAASAAQASAAQPGASLYDRLGGIFAIAAVVDRFSDAIIKNPKLNQNPQLAAWNRDEAPTRLAGLKVMRTIWIANKAGGPFQYTGMPLDEAHPRFKLTEAEFKEVGAEIVRALQFYKVPQREQQELVKAYNTSMADVVTEGQ